MATGGLTLQRNVNAMASLVSINSNPSLEFHFSTYGLGVLMTGLDATFNRFSWLLKLPDAPLLRWDIVSENLFTLYRACNELSL